MTNIIPHMSQLNSTAAGFGSPGPGGVDLIFNKARYMSTLVSRHFISVPFNEFYACPHLPIALVVV